MTCVVMCRKHEKEEGVKCSGSDSISENKRSIVSSERF